MPTIRTQAIVDEKEATARNLENAVLNMAERFHGGMWDLAECLYQFKSVKAYAELDGPDGKKFASFKEWVLAHKAQLRFGYSWSSTLVQAQSQRIELNLPYDQLPIDALQDTIPAVESLRQRTREKPRKSDADKAPLTRAEARHEAIRLIDQAVVLTPRDNKKALREEFNDVITLVDRPIPVSDLTDEQVGAWAASDLPDDAVVYQILRYDPKLDLEAELKQLNQDKLYKHVVIDGSKIAVRFASQMIRCTKCGHMIRVGQKYSLRARYNQRSGVYPFCERCRPWGTV